MPVIRKGRIGDFIRGADTWLHSNQMLFFSFAWVVLLGVVIAAALSVIYVYLFSDKCDLSNALTYFVAHLKGLLSPFSSISVGECVPVKKGSDIPLKMITEEQFFKEAASQVISNFGGSFVVAFMFYVPMGAFIAFKATKRGNEIKEDKYIRGAKLVSDDNLKKDVIKRHGSSNLTFKYVPSRYKSQIENYRPRLPSPEQMNEMLEVSGANTKTKQSISSIMDSGSLKFLPEENALKERFAANGLDHQAKERFLSVLNEYRQRCLSEYKASLAETFPLPAGFTTKHTLISGTTGAGKSTFLKYLLRSIRAHGHRAVIYDKKGEFVEKFYRDGIDHILNPSDSRSHQWTPWEEMASPFDADWIAETLIPENKSSGGDPFFRESPRHVFSAALQKLYLDGFRSLTTLLQATAWSDLELLKELVAGTPAETHFSEGNEKTLASIRSSLVNGVLPLRLLKESDSRGFFSIRDWIAQGDEQGADDSWLFLPVRESEIEVQKPLISTWIQSVAKGLMAQGVSNDRTLWLIVDELPSLKKIPALSMLMAEGRGFGAAVVLGIQEINQLEEEFGKNASKTILGLCSTQLHFRLNNSDTAEWVSKTLGEAEREEIDEDLNYSADDIRDGVRVSSKRQNRKIVLPSEIMDLPDLSCYAKVWGVEAKARIDIPFLHLPSISEGFVEGDENETVGMRLLNAARSQRIAVEPESAPNEQTHEEPSQNESSSDDALQEAQAILDSVGTDNEFLFSDALGGKKS